MGGRGRSGLEGSGNEGRVKPGRGFNYSNFRSDLETVKWKSNQKALLTGLGQAPGYCLVVVVSFKDD